MLVLSVNFRAMQQTDGAGGSGHQLYSDSLCHLTVSSAPRIHIRKEHEGRSFCSVLEKRVSLTEWETVVSDMSSHCKAKQKMISY